MKPRLQASKRVVSLAKLNRGQKKDYEPEHEGIHPVSYRGDLLSHRHLPIQLLHGRTRNRKEPAATSGEQHLHQSRFYLLCANHYPSGSLELIVYNNLKIKRLWQLI